MLSPLQRFLKWSVSDRWRRSISPFSELTVSQWTENRIREGTLDGLRAAMLMEPTNAIVAANLGRAVANYALAKGTDSNEGRRARAEADFQMRRALKLDPKSEEVKKVGEEIASLMAQKDPEAYPPPSPVTIGDFGPELIDRRSQEMEKLRGIIDRHNEGSEKDHFGSGFATFFSQSKRQK